jgi:hypothetical protein
MHFYLRGCLPYWQNLMSVGIVLPHVQSTSIIGLTTMSGFPAPEY